MTDLPDGIQVNTDGTPRLNGPRVIFDKDGRTFEFYVWAMLANGLLITTSFGLPLGRDGDDDPAMSPEGKQALEYLTYAHQYFTSGCMAERKPHRFMGDPQDVQALLTCLDCGHLKKLGVSLPGLTDMSGAKVRA